MPRWTRYSAYLALSLLAGTTEIGVALYVLQHSGSLAMLVISLSAYQIGGLFCNPLSLSRRGYGAALLAAVAFSLWSSSAYAFMLTVLLTSIGLQGTRELAKQGLTVSTATKRALRVTGFLLAALYSAAFLIAVPSLALCTLLFMVPGKPVANIKALNHRISPMGITMVIHQSHYFAYAYLMLPLFFAIAGHDHGPASRLVLVQVACAFCLGWISYTCSEWLLRRVLRLGDRLACVAGHLTVACCLLCMANWNGSASVLLVGWFVSGFGGGTVYCLRSMNSALAKPVDMDLWENVGHMSGLLLCGLSIMVSGGRIAVPFIVAAAAALTTALLVLLGDRSGRGADLQATEASERSTAGSAELES